MAVLEYVDDEGNDSCCPASLSGGGWRLYCTRSPDHDGDHLACGSPEKRRTENYRRLPVYARWSSARISVKE